MSGPLHPATDLYQFLFDFQSRSLCDHFGYPKMVPKEWRTNRVQIYQLTQLIANIALTNVAARGRRLDLADKLHAGHAGAVRRGDG
jgi:hypothetical protein